MQQNQNNLYVRIGIPADNIQGARLLLHLNQDHLRGMYADEAHTVLFMDALYPWDAELSCDFYACCLRGTRYTYGITYEVEEGLPTV